MILFLTLCAGFAAEASAQLVTPYSASSSGTGYLSPVEPEYPPITFYKQKPPTNLRERIDRLLYGMKVDVPPEYDHYGYEIRRYMAHVAGPEVIGDSERMAEELRNISNAQTILDYWRRSIALESRAIGEEIDRVNASSTIRSSFKFNRGLTDAFFTECQTWIEKNRDLLVFMQEQYGAYSLKEGALEFNETKPYKEFIAIYKAAIKSRGYINEYTPFAAMIY